MSNKKSICMKRLFKVLSIVFVTILLIVALSTWLMCVFETFTFNLIRDAYPELVESHPSGVRGVFIRIQWINGAIMAISWFLARAFAKKY